MGKPQLARTTVLYLLALLARDRMALVNLRSRGPSWWVCGNPVGLRVPVPVAHAEYLRGRGFVEPTHPAILCAYVITGKGRAHLERAVTLGWEACQTSS